MARNRGAVVTAGSASRLMVDIGFCDLDRFISGISRSPAAQGLQDGRPPAGGWYIRPVPERILIIRLAAIGDAAITSILLARVRAERPDAHVTWMCGSG